jgi:hypothetical protein
MLMSGSHLCIPRNETVVSTTELQCSVSQFLHSYICELFIYFQDRSAYSDTEKYVDRSWKYMNRSQTHNCGNWDGVIQRPLRKRSKMDARHTALVPKTNIIRQYRAGVYKLLKIHYLLCSRVYLQISNLLVFLKFEDYNKNP